MAYHPAANGLVERFHCQLKASLMSVTNSTWWIALPIVLLGICTCVKEDLGCFTAELVYGTTLRIPGQFFDSVEEIPDPLSFVSRVHTTLQQIRDKQPQYHTNQKCHINAELHQCTHVFVCRDAVRWPLQPPFDGPFKVHRQYSKFFTIIGPTGKPQTVSVDRLKPAHMDNPVVSTSPVPASPLAAAPPVVRTMRSGRRIHGPDRLVF